MKEIISKELLSQVLGYPKQIKSNVDYTLNITEILELKDSKLYFMTDSFGLGVCSINIYELAHKCKEWANITKGFYLSSGYDGMDNKWEAVMTQYTFPANTEP